MNDVDRVNVLIVDDKPQNLVSLEAVLEGPDINIVKAGSGNEALHKILKDDFALVLLDVQMPDMDGFETAEFIRGNKKTRHIPIIFVTAISKEKEHIFKGYESGAVDYIFKPLNPYILKNKVTVFIDLFRQKKIIETKNCELEKCNKIILEQQKALVEEERLKVILQMAGAAAHELSNPLMILLENLEKIALVKDDHQKVFKLIPEIQNAGQTISDTVKKIQNVRYDLAIDHDDGKRITQPAQEIKILSVEDSDIAFNLLKVQLIKQSNFKLLRAKTIKEALSSLHRMTFDILLLDYELPDGTGLELLTKLKLENIDLPVIGITGIGSEEVASDFIKAGAFDYLSKTNFNRQSLIKTIHSSLEKFGLKKEIDRSIKQIVDNSTKDQLTGLYNRRYMEGVLEKEVERSRRYNSELCCLILDLDFFKAINDTHGHLCGDFVLQEFAKLLKNTKRHSDYIFRYGGEEFVILAPQVDIKRAVKFADKLRNRCQVNDFMFEGNRLNITVSIGVASFNNKTVDKAITLIQLADKALYDAKRDGRNCVKVYELK